MRAARAAASISAFAARRIFSASDFASARMRSASAAASFCASSRNPRTSCSRRARRCSASFSFRSASAFAAVAFVMAELIFSAFARNVAGRTLPNAQINVAATVRKLIHLKSSADPAAFAPPSSAACATAAKKVSVPHTKSDETMSLRSFIEPLGMGLREFRGFSMRFHGQAGELRLPCRDALRVAQPLPVPWR